MDWVDALHGKTVALDTAPFIYFIERDAEFISLVRPFFLAVHEGRIRVVTSVVTLMEVLVKPLRQHRYEIIKEYGNYSAPLVVTGINGCPSRAS